jgi:hypothetical protein
MVKLLAGQKPVVCVVLVLWSTWVEMQGLAKHDTLTEASACRRRPLLHAIFLCRQFSVHVVLCLYFVPRNLLECGSCENSHQKIVGGSLTSFIKEPIHLIMTKATRVTGSTLFFEIASITA